MWGVDSIFNVIKRYMKVEILKSKTESEKRRINADY